MELLTHSTIETLHGVSTRRGGWSKGPYSTLNLAGRVGDNPLAVKQNRMAFMDALGASPEQAVVARQVHGSRVILVQQADAGRDFSGTGLPAEEADGLITKDPNIVLLVLAADCVPILLWDPVQGAVGAVHAGWRGTVAGVTSEAIAAMGRAFGTRPEDVRAGVGPGIGPCCYEVDALVVEPLRAKDPVVATEVLVKRRPGHWMLDLPEANRAQLLQSGLRETNIGMMPLCTSCHHDLLFSQRVEGYPCGRFAAAIAVT